MKPVNLCRNCGAELPSRYALCPRCGARQQGAQGYEWKSQATWMGAPLLHVAFGMDAAGRPRTARGVIAIGQRAIGGLAVGVLASGFIAIGLVAIGLVSFGVVAIAALAACGVNAVAPAAFGVVAFGFAASGLAPIGWKPLFGIAGITESAKLSTGIAPHLG